MSTASDMQLFDPSPMGDALVEVVHASKRAGRDWLKPGIEYHVVEQWFCNLHVGGAVLQGAWSGDGPEPAEAAAAVLARAFRTAVTHRREYR